MPLYLGIDAGGTKTDCAISNGAELLGQATGESCKAARVGEEVASRNLQHVIVQACEAAKVKPFEVHQVCIGIAGASVPGTEAWAQNVIHELITGKITVVGDHVIAHRAAFGMMPGLLVIAGTGSIAYGRNQKGETGRAGGWGPLVSDEGSAFWIGKEAVAAALHAWDKGRNNGLLSAISASWNVSAPEEVIRIANFEARLKFPGLASVIATAAEQGDPVAQNVLERAGTELAGLAGAVIGRLWPLDGAARVAMAGGVLQGSAITRGTFHKALKTQYPTATVSFAYVRPVMGALEIAAERVVGQFRRN